MNKLKLLGILGVIQVMLGLGLLIVEIYEWLTNRAQFMAILFLLGLIFLFGGLDALKRYARMRAVLRIQATRPAASRARQPRSRRK